MRLNRRMNNTYTAPKVEVVKIDPPNPLVEEKQNTVPRKKGFGGLGSLGNLGGLGNFFKNIKFDGEDILLIGLMLLFMNMEDEDYSMMLPALIYIFMG